MVVLHIKTKETQRGVEETLTGAGRGAVLHIEAEKFGLAGPAFDEVDQCAFRRPVIGRGETELGCDFVVGHGAASQ